MKKIKLILDVFHEGVIEELHLENKDLNFKIECKYLAEIINENYTWFYGVLKNVRRFCFQPWDDEDNVITNIENIKELKPDILGVDMSEEEFVKIYSNCNSVYGGGNIIIDANDIRVFDEDFREMGMEELLNLSDKYWAMVHGAEG
ncbi:MAG TPA: hypothetical protein VIK89_13325 [Cytophagaceae bacterium]